MTVDKKKYVRLYALYSFLLHHVLQKVLQVDTDTILALTMHVAATDLDSHPDPAPATHIATSMS